MVNFSRILCPVDFSEASEHAIAHAVAIARWYQSSVTALHVSSRWFGYEPPILFAERGGLATNPVSREQLEQMLEASMQPAAQAHVRFETRIEQGAAADRVLECARLLPADLIVVGTHGRGGFERLIIGSVAEKVLRNAGCPVLTVPPRAVATASLPYRRIVCAVDFSEPSRQALQTALSMAEEADAQLTLLHAIDWRDDEMFLTEPFVGSDIRQRAEVQALDRLNALIPEEAREWCRVSVSVAVGSAHRQIVATANESGADLIVIGVHGRNVFDLTLLGSTTNQVVRRASCPVLTIRDRQ